MANYAERQEVARHLNIGGTAETTDLDLYVAAAMDVVHDYCGWRFDQTSATYTFDVHDPVDLDLGDLPLALTTGVTITEDPNDSGTYSAAVDSSDYLLLPRNGRRSGIEWPRTTVRRVDGTWPSSSRGRPTVQIAGTFGWPAVPPSVKTATIHIAAWLWTNKASPGGALVTEFGPIPMHRIPVAERMLARYRRGELIAAIGTGRARS